MQPEQTGQTQTQTAPQPDLNSTSPRRPWRERPMEVVIYSSILASLAGFVISDFPYVLDWITGVLLLTFNFAIFGLLPMLIAQLIFNFAFRHSHKSHRSFSWWPGILYALVMLMMGWILGSAFQMPRHQEAGSEFVPLIIVYISVVGCWIIPLISLIVNTIWWATSHDDTAA